MYEKACIMPILFLESLTDLKLCSQGCVILFRGPLSDGCSLFLAAVGLHATCGTSSTTLFPW